MSEDPRTEGLGEPVVDLPALPPPDMPAVEEATGKKRKKEKVPPAPKKVGAPTKAALGWLEPGGTRKDAVEFAKGYAGKWMDAPEASWFAVVPFMGGYLWEVHEGGPGLSYLPGTVRALSDPNAPLAWFRVAGQTQRAFQVSMRDGVPFLVLQPGELSRAIMEGKVGQMTPKGKMLRVIRRGTRVFASGLATFSAGMSFLVVACVYDVAGRVLAPDARRLDQEQLPHRQWQRVERVPPNLFVETMRFKDQAWTTSIKPVRNPQRAVVSPAAVPRPQPASVTTAPETTVRPPVPFPDGVTPREPVTIPPQPPSQPGGTP